MSDQAIADNKPAETPGYNETPFDKALKTVMLIWFLALLVLLIAYARCRSFEPPAPMALRLTIAALVTPMLMVFALADAGFGRHAGLQRFAGVAIGIAAIWCAWLFYRLGMSIEFASIQGAFVPFLVMRIWDSARTRWRRRV